MLLRIDIRAVIARIYEGGRCNAHMHFRRARIAQKLYDAAVELAGTALAESGKKHFELEKIYTANMDFEALGAFVDILFEKIK